MSVAAIVAGVRSAARPAVAVVTAALARAEASQGTLNAFTLVERERALARAAAVDARVAAGEDPGPLAGVPVAVKDLIDEAGVPNTAGAGGFPAVVPERSATVVARLEAAGAVVVGRTGLHEFAFGFTSENAWFGPVRNPWDRDLSPGGSSGGSAAAVAAGVVPVAIGTDTGGSVRVPAALCGVVGLKVTHGRVSLRGVVPLAPSLDTVGPLGRSVGDVAALYAAVAGDDREDPWSVPVPVTRPGGPADLASLRVAVPRPWLEGPLDAAVAAAFREALGRLAAAGAEVTEVDDPALVLNDAARRGAYVEVAAVHRDRFVAYPQRYGPKVAARLEEALAVPAEVLVAALAWRAGARHALERIFARYDVLATPTVAATAKRIGVETIEVAGTPIFHRRLLAAFTPAVNGVGLPALALPLPGGPVPPASLQLVGPAFGEARLLEIGFACEAAGVTVTSRPPHWFG